MNRGRKSDGQDRYHLHRKDDMTVRHGLGSVLLGLRTRSTRNGGRRKGFLAVMAARAKGEVEGGASALLSFSPSFLFFVSSPYHSVGSRNFSQRMRITVNGSRMGLFVDFKIL